MEKDIFIYGIRAVLEAIHEGKEFERLFIQRGPASPLMKELLSALKEKQVAHQFVPVEKLNRLGNRNHQGVAAVISTIMYQPLEPIVQAAYESGHDPMLIILDRVTDVRNTGAIARTAECAGADALILPSRGGAMLNADAIKASAGALHRIPVCREENLKLTLAYIRDAGLKIISCSEKGNRTIYEEDLTGPVALIMGSEEDGISPEYLKRSDNIVRIPMHGETASLNVSVAAGILLFETLRQRSLRPEH